MTAGKKRILLRDWYQRRTTTKMLNLVSTSVGFLKLEYLGSFAWVKFNISLLSYLYTARKKNRHTHSIEGELRKKNLIRPKIVTHTLYVTTLWSPGAHSSINATSSLVHIVPIERWADRQPDRQLTATQAGRKASAYCRHCICNRNRRWLHICNTFRASYASHTTWQVLKQRKNILSSVMWQQKLERKIYINGWFKIKKSRNIHTYICKSILGISIHFTLFSFNGEFIFRVKFLGVSLLCGKFKMYEILIIKS